MVNDQTDSKFLVLCKVVLDQISDSETREKQIGDILELKYESKMSGDDYIQYQFFKALSEMYRFGIQNGKHENLPLIDVPKTILQNRVYVSNKSLHKSIAADEFAMKMAPFIREIRGAGPISLYEIADKLNEMGLAASKGGKWHPGSVRSIESRLEKIQARVLEI